MWEVTEDPFVCAMMEKLRSYGPTGTLEDPYSIHRVPPNIREGDPGSYEPQILSIGRQSQATSHGVSQVEVPAQSPPKTPEPLHPGSEKNASRWSGCLTSGGFHGESEDDPIRNVGRMFNVVERYILKLENQIPFFILEHLFDVTVGRGITDWSLRQHAFYYVMLRRADETPLTEHKIHHLLHFYDVILLPESPNSSTNTLPSSSRVQSRSFTLPTWREPKPTDKMSETTIPCAVELGEVGIKLRRKPAENFLDVTFQDGTLSIPFLSIGQRTNSVFKNLVALEQCHPDVGSHFTWYMAFLNCFVNTQLINLENMLSVEEAAQLINLFDTEMIFTRRNHKFAELFREVNKYCQSRWHKYRARLMRDYFSNPWSIISLVAAFFLLLMTAAQVVLAVLSYNKQ